MDKEMRYWRGYVIPYPLARQLLTGQARLLDIPVDAELMHVANEPLRHSFLLIFEHRSFAPVPAGEMTPVHLVHIERVGNAI